MYHQEMPSFTAPGACKGKTEAAYQKSILQLCHCLHGNRLSRKLKSEAYSYGLYTAQALCHILHAIEEHILCILCQNLHPIYFFYMNYVTFCISSKTPQVDIFTMSKTTLLDYLLHEPCHVLQIMKITYTI